MPVVASMAITYGLLWAAMHSPIYSAAALFPHKGANEYYSVDSILGYKRAEHFIPTSNGDKLHAWYFARPDAKFTVIVNHGNAGNMAHRLMLAKTLLGCGYSVMLYDYRGYGLSEGQSTLSTLVPDGLSVYKYAKDTLGVQPSQLVLYGESIGSTVACAVANEKDCAGLILQSGVASVPAIAKEKFVILNVFPEFLFPAPALDNTSILKSFKKPLLIVHGAKDFVVPYSHSVRLSNAATSPNKSVVTLEHAGHNDVVDVDGPAFTAALTSFLKGLPQ